MRDKLLQIRVDEEFLSKLEYLKEINGYKNTADTVRKTAEKEWRREQINMNTIEKEGTWIQRPFCDDDICSCSNCGYNGMNILRYKGMDISLSGRILRTFKSCPNCGAKMYKEQVK